MKKIISVFSIICLIFIVVFVCQKIKLTTDSDKTYNFSSITELCRDLENENIDISNTNEYDVCILIGVKEASPYNDTQIDDFDVSDEGDVDEALRHHREKVKDYYFSLNENALLSLNIDHLNYFVSFYSPYIEIVFNDLDEYKLSVNDLLSSIDYSDQIASVSNYIVTTKDNMEASISDSTYDTNYILADAFNDIGVSDSSYTGNGVKVGILDGGIPQETQNLKIGKYTYISGSPILHTTVIASIIGGNSGIAENAHLYFMQKSNSLVADFNVLLGYYGVNIINISFANATAGHYLAFDAYLDYIISNTGCTIVVSAGNEGSENPKITAPGCSMNAITVGSINYDQNISADSSWKTSESFLLKPDVVAPGERLWNIGDLDNGEDGHSGTSYAAPMVVGTIALLMEEFPGLKTKPALVKSVLHLSASKLPSQTEYYDEQAGFGLINYQNMRNCLLGYNRAMFYIPYNASESDVLLSFNTTIPYYSEIFINANSIVASSVTKEGYAPANPEYNNYTIRICDNATSNCVATSSVDSSVDYLVFRNEDQNNSSFSIEIIMVSDNEIGRQENASIAFKILPHQHSYTVHEQYSTSQHKAYCECGNYVLQDHYFFNGSCTLCGMMHEHDYTGWAYYSNFQHIQKCDCGQIGTTKKPHVLRSSDTGRYKMCIECNTLIDTNTGGGLINSTKIMVSLNGSYIMPNGIIILVDEDIDAYLNGDLIFYDPNENVESI